MASRLDPSTGQERAYSDGSSTDSAILQQCLGLHSIIPTVSSFSRRSQDARSQPVLQQMNQIGVGLQGAVFEQVGKPLALKNEHPGNERLFSNLRHEYNIHRDVSDAFERYQSLINSVVHVPELFEFVSKAHNNAFWDDLLLRFPRLTARVGMS